MSHSIVDHRLDSALTIAGSDSGAGAGIQADLKTFAAHGVFAESVLTLVTAQSTSSVDAVHLLPEEIIQQQFVTVFADFRIRAAKTGALGSQRTIRLVSDFLRGLQAGPQLVVDPVMISKHGHTLLEPDAVDSLRHELLPLATVVTPNIPEAQVLAKAAPGSSREWMLDTAGMILRLGCGAVVLKGGHRTADAVDLLLTSDGPEWMEGERLDSPHTHGTGCTFSAALAAGLLQGNSLLAATANAKAYVAGAIRHAQVHGRGVNAVNHFWRHQATGAAAHSPL